MDDDYTALRKEVNQLLSCSAHDMQHISRVYNLALTIAKDYDANLDILKPAVLLHDIGRIKEDNDPTGNTDHAVESARMAVSILDKYGFAPENVEAIRHCILSHRYRTEHIPKTIEAKILFDADKLDTVGAIGVARGYMWIGKHNAKIFSDEPIEDYIQRNLGGRKDGRIQDITQHSPNIEFELKFRHIINKLYTQKAKDICKDRIEFYRQFLDRLKSEIEGSF